MINEKLENLLKIQKQLGAEFDLTQLCRDSKSFSEQIQAVKDFFCNNAEFMESFQTADCQSDLGSLIDKMINLGIVYSYYFLLDYLFRQKQDFQEFGFSYLRSDIFFTSKKNASEKNDFRNDDSENDDSEKDERDIYNRYSKQFDNFYQSSSLRKDPMHYNPYVVSQDIMQDKKKRRHFGGNISLYFQKILLEDSKGPTTGTSYKQYKIQDLLPAFTLMCLKATKFLPLGSYVKSGNFSVKKLRELSRMLHITTLPVKNSSHNSIPDDLKVCMECRHPKLLYELAREDLFCLLRLNNTIEHYIDFMKKYSSDTKLQQNMLSTLFSLFYYMPSVVFQNYYADSLEMHVWHI